MMKKAKTGPEISIQLSVSPSVIALVAGIVVYKVVLRRLKKRAS